MSGAYYNEHDPVAAEWLRRLIAAGHIAPGVVDERSIEDVLPDELVGFTQCHFFAGIGIWSYALRRAGFSDDRRVWTGSCPCQPFSAAGEGKGLDDKRHLWPAWHRLIVACRPGLIIGEQVAASAVVGPSNDEPRMPGLFDYEADDRLRAEWKGKMASRMQGVHRVDAEAKRRSRAPVRYRVSTEEPGTGSGASREGASDREGSSVRSVRSPDENSGSPFRRFVRVDWTPVQSRRRPDMGQSIDRSSGAGEGVRLLEHSHHLSRHEQRDRRLGRRADADAREGADGPTEGEVERFVAALGGSIEANDEQAWIDLVSADLERAGYAVGSCDTPAASYGAPHIRQRLYWMADTDRDAAWGAGADAERAHAERSQPVAGGRSAARVVADAGSVRCGDGAGPGSDAGTACGDRGRKGVGPQRLRPESGAGRSGFVRLASYSNGRLADPAGARSQGRDAAGQRTDAQRPAAERGGDAGGMADAAGAGLGVERGRRSDRARDARPHADEHHDGDEPGPTNGFWRDADWLLCRDGRWRAVEPGTFPLVTGFAGRVGALRAYGNGLNAAQAQGFVEAVMETIE